MMDVVCGLAVSQLGASGGVKIWGTGAGCFSLLWQVRFFILLDQKLCFDCLCNDLHPHQQYY